MHTCLHHTRKLNEILKQKTIQFITKNEILDLNYTRELEIKIENENL